MVQINYIKVRTQSVSAVYVRRLKEIFSRQTIGLGIYNILKLLLILVPSFFLLNTVVVTKTYAQESVQEKIENFDQLPDGQTLLLRPKVGRLVYDNDIYVLKKEGRLYYAFTDVIDVLGLAINYDEKTKQGAGWFLREDWDTQIDFENNRISVRGTDFELSKSDIIEKDNILFVAENNIQKWFEIEFAPDIAQQYVEVDSPHPLPAIAKNARKNKRISYRNDSNLAILPRHRAVPKWFDINTLDVRLGSRLRRRSSGLSAGVNEFNHQGVFTAQGQVLKHNAYGLATFDNQGGLTSITTRLSERDEKAVLLGPLRARSYMIGDTDIADIPLTGDARQELGFHVSNSQLTNTQFETTDVNGDAIPGWDVELYRNNILINTLTVDESGRYEFSDTQLFAGNNDFDLYFYGPQGEVRTKEINIPVTAALLASQDNIYDISVSLTDTQTYRRDVSDNTDRETLHVAAKYNKALGDTLAYVGFRNRDVEGENKTHVGLGFSRIIQNTLIDFNAGIDDDAETAFELSARRKIRGWDLLSDVLVQSENFTPDGGDTPLKYKITTSAQRSFKPTKKIRGNIFTRGSLSENHVGQKILSRELGGAIQIGRVSISDTLRYDTIKTPQGDKNKQLDNNLSFRVISGKYLARGGLNYDIYPERKVDNYFAQLSYRPNRRFSGDLNFDYDPDRDYKSARLNLNFTNDYFKTSPFIEVDSNDDIQAGVNLNFSIIDKPSEGGYAVTSKRLAGRGLVSSFVYYDKNGNEVFDGDDEALPDVVVESVNIRRREMTNENGYSMMNDLPTSRATDIHIDESTLPDSFMMAGFEGVSVLPEAGEVVELQFPIHMAGEIDGTISLMDENQKLYPFRRGKIDLYPLDKNSDKVIRTEAASDGFFVASQIPPGKYLVVVNNDTVKRAKAGAPPPQVIEIGYGGGMLYGMDMTLDSAKPAIPIKVSYNDVEASKEIYKLQTSPEGQSQLTTLLTEYAKLQQVAQIGDAINPALIEPAAGGDVVLALNDPVSAYEQCQKLAMSAVPCTLEVIIPFRQ